MAVLNAAPYSGGMLAKGPDRWAKYAYREAPPELIQRVRQIDQVCQQYNVPLAAAALQFSLRDPRITSTIVGMTRPERLAQTVKLALHPIPDDLWSQLEAIQTSEVQ
jgi:D-threo-aldose 1-dehydrogenase